MENIIYLLCGACFGCLGSMLGIGGGPIIVPVLIFVLGFTPQQSVGTSMFIVLLNAVSGAFVYLKQKKVYLDAAVKFAIATIPGSFLGSYAVEYLKGKLFFFIFGVFFVLFALDMLRKTFKAQAAEESTAVPKEYNWQLGVLYSTAIGFVASILGIGGGIMHVPMMTYALKFPVKVAVATSTTILCISTFAGVVSHAMLGHITWSPALVMGAGAVAGAQLGVVCAGKAKSSLLLRLISVIILLMGLKFLSYCW